VIAQKLQKPKVEIWHVSAIWYDNDAQTGGDLAITPAVGCHYFQPDLWLASTTKEHHWPWLFGGRGKQV